LSIDTVLGTDSSATDRLILSGGGATGTTGLQIQNAGGLGALTVANGIQVIEAVNGATTAANAFNLVAPVTAGPYEYLLYRGSVDTSSVNSWYLRSTLDCSLAPNASVCASPTITAPNYRQEVSLYSALPQMATLYGMTLLDTLHQRVGEQEQLRGRGDPRDFSQFNGIWGRIIGQFGKREGGATGIYGNDGPRFDYRTYALQVGMDLYRRETAEGHRDHAGIYGAIGQITSDVWHAPHNVRAGTNRLDGYTVGGYWTHFGPSGWYVDAIAQATRYDAEANSSRPGYSLDTHGWSFAGSLEGGLPIKFRGGWIIEPQAQLVYQNVSLDSALDRSARFEWADAESLTGRLGLRFVKTWQQEGNRAAVSPALQTMIWGRINFWREFMGAATMFVSSANGPVPFHRNVADTWVELQAGATSQLTLTTSLYGNAGVKLGLDGKSQAYEGRLGIRVNW
jgi:outer membrane autotransporter protein